MKKGFKKRTLTKTAPKMLTMIDKLPKNEIERLELIIRMTENCIVPGRKNETMTDQAIRLRAKLEEMKKNL